MINYQGYSNSKTHSKTQIYKSK